MIFAPTSAAPVTKTPPLFARDAWRPLLIDEISCIGEVDRIRMEWGDMLPGTFIYIPAGWVGDAPAYWRWHPNDPSIIEVSCMRLREQGNLETETFNVPNWLRDDEEYERWRVEPNAELSSEVLNAIGFALSFAWRMHDYSYWYFGFPGVDFDLAISYFERAELAPHIWTAPRGNKVDHCRGLLNAGLSRFCRGVGRA